MGKIQDVDTNAYALKGVTNYYSGLESQKIEESNYNVNELIQFFAQQIQNKLIENDNNKACFVCIDGPSGSGKNTLLDFFKRSNNSRTLSILDTNVFMKPRYERNDKENDSLFINWYRTGFFKRVLVDFLDSNKNLIIDQAYKHDINGDISHLVIIPPDPFRILLGRYSLHNEIQELFKSQLIDVKKVIIDAPQSLRLDRVKKRAYTQKHRATEEQEALIIDTVDPDWFRYFPSVFLTADWYIVNYSNSYSVCRKPQECINRSHVWGAFADLHVQPERIYRLIEIGKNGATSLHLHENLDEIYFHVLGGPLGVTLMRGFSESDYILFPGESLKIPHGVYHKAYAINDQPPLYYETVLPVHGSYIDNNDIKKLSKAMPMSGSLSYLL